LEVVFEALRRLSNYDPLPDIHAFMDPVGDAYDMANQKISNYVARPAEVRDVSTNRFIRQYLPNFFAPSGSRQNQCVRELPRSMVDSCSGHCPCHDSLTKEVEKLKKQMASMTEQVGVETISIINV
jgi:hypothetical protein